ncbi:unnamed protein product [Phaeothamnion confervicola]
MTKTRSERKGAKMEAKFAKETKAAREEGRKKQKPPWAGLLLPAGMMILAYIGHLYIDVVERRRSAPLKDDIFITSYPRSGNNWARFLLAHLWLYGGAESGDDGGQTGAWEREFDFNSIETVVPDLERGPSRRSFYDFGAPRLFKSHQPYAPEMGARCHETMDPLQCACPNCPPRWRKVLHFVRDGRDAVCSYYHFRRVCVLLCGSWVLFLFVFFPLGGKIVRSQRCISAGSFLMETWGISNLPLLGRLTCRYKNLGKNP